MKTTVLIFVLLNFAPQTFAQGGISAGTFTANEYKIMDEFGRIMWVRGTIDGILVESAMNATGGKESNTWLSDCVRGKTFIQLQAIFEKELNANPEHWEKAAAVFLWSALFRYCKESS